MKSMLKRFCVVVCAVACVQCVYGMNEEKSPLVQGIEQIANISLSEGNTTSTPSVETKNPWSFLNAIPGMGLLKWTCGYAKKNPGKVLVGTVLVGVGTGSCLYLTKDARATKKNLKEIQKNLTSSLKSIESMQLIIQENNKTIDEITQNLKGNRKGIKDLVSSEKNKKEVLVKKLKDMKKEQEKSLNDLQNQFSLVDKQMDSLSNGQDGSDTAVQKRLDDIEQHIKNL